MRPVSSILLVGYSAVLALWTATGSGRWSGIRTAVLAVAALGLVAGVGLIRGARWAWIAGATVAGFGVASGAGLFVRRLHFVILHGGMDCGTCDGSPLAFLVGWIAEQAVVTVPWGLLSLLMWREWSAER